VRDDETRLDVAALGLQRLLYALLPKNEYPLVPGKV
jgi:hypothetical protein